MICLRIHIEHIYISHFLEETEMVKNLLNLEVILLVVVLAGLSLQSFDIL